MFQIHVKNVLVSLQCRMIHVTRGYYSVRMFITQIQNCFPRGVWVGKQTQLNLCMSVCVCVYVYADVVLVLAGLICLYGMFFGHSDTEIHFCMLCGVAFVFAVCLKGNEAASLDK